MAIATASRERAGLPRGNNDPALRADETLGDWHALLGHLRDCGFPVTIDREIRFAALLFRMSEAGIVLNDAKQAAEYLGPILCGSADDQKAFADILDDWYKKRDKPVGPSPSDALRRADRLRILFSALVVIVILTALLVAARFDFLPELSRIPPAVENFVTSQRNVVQLPLPDSQVKAMVEGLLSRSLFALPAIIALILVLGRRRTDWARLSRRAGEAELIETFAIPVGSSDLFRSIPSRTAIYELNRATLVHSDRIDVLRTVGATIRSCGWPTIFMASRRTSREIVLLVDSNSSADHVRLLADALEHRLRAADALLTRYDFRVSPGRVRFVSGRTDGAMVEDLSVVAARHRQQKLVIVSIGEGLVEPQRGRSSTPWFSTSMSFPVSCCSRRPRSPTGANVSARWSARASSSRR